LENLKKFAQNLLDGKLEVFIKSEPAPENNDGPVKVRVLFFLFINKKIYEFSIIFRFLWRRILTKLPTGEHAHDEN
jgi:hypothetical protein